MYIIPDDDETTNSPYVVSQLDILTRSTDQLAVFHQFSIVTTSSTSRSPAYTATSSDFAPTAHTGNATSAADDIYGTTASRCDGGNEQTIDELDVGVSVVLTVILAVVFVVSIVGNGSVLYVVGRHLRCRTSTNIFVTALSISDLAGAITCVPTTLVALYWPSALYSSDSDGDVQVRRCSSAASRDLFLHGSVVCIVHDLALRTSHLLSTAMLSLLTVDRYATIVQQRRRSNFVASRTVFVVLVAVACSAALSVCWYAIRATIPTLLLTTSDSSSPTPCLLGGLTFYELAFCGLTALCPAALVAYCAVRIVRVVWHRRTTAVLPNNASANQLLFYDELQTAVTVVIMAAGLIVCRVVQFALVLALVVSSIGRRPSGAARAFDVSVTLVVLLDGAVNPLVYATRNPNVARILHVNVWLPSRVRRRGYMADSASGNQPGLSGQPPPTPSAGDMVHRLGHMTMTADLNCDIRNCNKYNNNGTEASVNGNRKVSNHDLC